jgi:hypothetical protein
MIGFQSVASVGPCDGFVRQTAKLTGGERERERDRERERERERVLKLGNIAATGEKNDLTNFERETLYRR